jgi:hypothetical protein
MPTLTMPAVPGFVESAFSLVPKSQTFRSSLNAGAVQTTELGAALWQARYKLPAMTLGQAAAWRAFAAALRGSAGRFYGFDPDLRSPIGAYDAGLDTLLVDGAAQTGVALAIKGGRPSATIGIVEAGSYFQVGDELKVVTERFDVDGSGDGTLTFEPALVAAPADAAPLILVNPVAIMQLASDASAAWSGDLSRITRGFSFAAIEAY